MKTAHYYYYVSNGVLCKVVGEIELSYVTAIEGVLMNGELSVSLTCDVTDIGTTVIARPEGLPEAN